MKEISTVAKSESKEKKIWKILYSIIFFIGIILMIFEITIFRKTVIKVYIPILIILVFGFIGFYFSEEHYKKTYSISGNFIPLIQNLCSWGFICCYVFMAANYYLADSVSKEYNVVIKEKSSMPGPKANRSEREPLVRFDYFGFEKELVFKFRETEKVNSADSVKVIIKKGGFGFDILQSYDVF